MIRQDICRCDISMNNGKGKCSFCDKTIIETKRVKCHKCKYSWNTRSKLLYVSCPNCNIKNYIGGKK